MSRAVTLKPENGSEPAWQIARLFPDQGAWHTGDYLELNRRTNHLVEFCDGLVEVLEMPTRSHQRIVLFLYNALLSFTAPQRLGEVLVAPYPVRLREGKYREPDILFTFATNAGRMHEDYAEGADLVIEVVSDDRRKDLETKRAEYAEAGIPEYWIVDPREQRITVLTLQGDRYAIHGDFVSGQMATSSILPGVAIDVSAALAARE